MPGRAMPAAASGSAPMPGDVAAASGMAVVVDVNPRGTRARSPQVDVIDSQSPDRPFEDRSLGTVVLGPAQIVFAGVTPVFLPPDGEPFAYAIVEVRDVNQSAASPQGTAVQPGRLHRHAHAGNEHRPCIVEIGGTGRTPGATEGDRIEGARHPVEPVQPGGPVPILPKAFFVGNS